MDASHVAPPLAKRNLLLRPGPIPETRLKGLAERSATLVVRQDSSSTSSNSSSTQSCAKNDNSGACEKYYNPNDTTLPIILGVVIPVSVALILMFFLHRRHLKKLRREDAEDRTKSLDFGFQEIGAKGKRKRGKGQKEVPEMTLNEAKGVVRQERGLSMDLGLPNPYLLPPELQESRESLHSMSRSLHTGDDKYRATDFIPDDGSIRPPSSARSRLDDSSSFTGSTQRRFDTDSSRGLVINRPRRDTSDSAGVRKPPPSIPHNASLLAPKPSDSGRDSYLSTTSSNGAVAALRASNNYLGAFISGGNKMMPEQKREQITTTVAEIPADSPTQAPRQPSSVLVRDERAYRQSIYEMPAVRDSLPSHIPNRTSDSREQQLSTALGPEIQIHEFPGSQPPPTTVPPPRQELPAEITLPTPQHTTEDHPRPVSKSHGHDVQDDDATSDYYDEEGYGDYEDYMQYDNRQSIMGTRPLPPDDPSENPEQRAIRIRSFYKEYFDETDPSKPSNGVNYYDGSEDYMEDYMAYYEHGNSRVPSRAAMPDGRQRAMSSGSYMASPRAYSIASSRMGGSQQRGPPKKQLPPPKALHILPTPSKLSDDSFIPNAADYAPPQKFKNQRTGTPDSLRGGKMPYSPSVRAHVPLVSAFDDLGAIPSPHTMGTSSAYTGLDFAPPRRFKDGDTMSDSGSVRSNGSAMSARQLDHIRKGAYRVSRIPKEVAGTRNELQESLRPKMDMNR